MLFAPSRLLRHPQLSRLTLALILPLSQAGVAREDLTPFAGFYQGAFDTAITADPLDDMNTNPCRDCAEHGAPLQDIYLQVAIGDKGKPAISFHREVDGPAIDLLGQYCHSQIGPLASLESERGEGKDSGEQYRVHRAVYAFDPGRCSRNIAQNKDPELTLSLLQNETRGMHFARVQIDKDLRRVVSLTAKNREGERVPVQSNPADYGKDRRETRSYQYENEMGETTGMRSNVTETRSFALPVALGGYVGANLTWWPHKILDVEAETEEVLTHHTGVFMPLPDSKDQ